MSILDMGSSFLDDLEMKEGVVVQLKDESRNSLMMENVGVNCFDLESEFDFSPIQHPTEPSHEDRPVQCPMPHSSPLINDERMQDDRFSGQKMSGAKTVLHKDHITLDATEVPVRMVRKRHYDHTNTIMPLPLPLPLLPPPPAYPHSHQKLAFSKLQQVHKFES